jgi:hypothetical protein
MPPRRSTKAADAAESAAPAKLPAGKRTVAKSAIAKPAARGRKRAPANAEPESDETPEPQSPPRKRARSTSKAAPAIPAKVAKVAKPAKKADTKPAPRARSKSAAPLARKATDASIASSTSTKRSAKKATPAPETLPQSVPYFNPLPKAPEHGRPALQLFGWGAGNFGRYCSIRFLCLCLRSPQDNSAWGRIN